MSAPTRPVPSSQQRAFELALAEYLGIDPQAASLNTWRIDDDGGRVTLDFFLSGDELLEMFNTGKVLEGHASPLIARLTSEPALAAFREAWAQADAEGATGDRVRRGMVAAIEVVL